MAYSPPPIRELITAIRCGMSYRLLVELVEVNGKPFLELRTVSSDPATWERPSRERLRLPIEHYRRLEAAIAQLRKPAQAKLTALRHAPRNK